MVKSINLKKLWNIDVLSNAISFFCYMKNVMDEIGVFKSWGSTSEGNMPADDGFFKKKDKFFQ